MVCREKPVRGSARLAQDRNLSGLTSHMPSYVRKMQHTQQVIEGGQ